MFSTDWDNIVRPLAFPPVERAERMVAGRNSRVHRLEGGGKTIVVKQYHCEEGRRSLRQEREHAGLQFLWSEGVRSIPEVLWNDFDHGTLLLSFLDGSPIARPTLTDIGAAVGFLERLRSCCDARNAQSLANASDAAFRLEDLHAGIRGRIDRLIAEREVSSSLEGSLAQILERDLPRSLSNALKAASKTLGNRQLPQRARTLSPSDFGFHNAIRTRDGLAFVDFEHFGWDDPAKTIADFVLHPGMALDQDLCASFTERTLGVFSDTDPELMERTRLLGPLYATKWATIVLNEFLPESAARRAFAGADTQGDERLLLGQIDKARRLLCGADNFASMAGL